MWIKFKIIDNFLIIFLKNPLCHIPYRKYIHMCTYMDAMYPYIHIGKIHIGKILFGAIYLYYIYLDQNIIWIDYSDFNYFTLWNA